MPFLVYRCKSSDNWSLKQLYNPPPFLRHWPSLDKQAQMPSAFRSCPFHKTKIHEWITGVWNILLLVWHPSNPASIRTHFLYIHSGILWIPQGWRTNLPINHTVQPKPPSLHARYNSQWQCTHVYNQSLNNLPTGQISHQNHPCHENIHIPCQSHATISTATKSRSWFLLYLVLRTLPHTLSAVSHSYRAHRSGRLESILLRISFTKGMRWVIVTWQLQFGG